MKKEVKYNINIIIISAALIITLYYTINPVFIGFVVFNQGGFEASNLSLFDYNPEEIDISNGIISLKGTETTYDWTTYSQEEFPITRAFYNPSNKLSEINSQDSDTFEINKGKISNFVFENYLESGDIITLYLKNKDATNIYACMPNEQCNSSEHGFVYFPDVDGYYNFTLENLEYPTKVISLDADKNIKLDYITSSKGNISGFWYNPSDKTDKYISFDNDSFTLDHDEVFDLKFNELIYSGDVLQLYLEDKNPTEINICDASTLCNSSEQGSADYDGTETWLNISLSLNNPVDSFGVKASTQDIKPDFINVIRITEHENSETNTTYPLTANITTEDLIINDLESWGSLSAEEELNSQNISYEYSTDSGETWFSVSEDKNLSSANIESGKIKIKAVLSGNESSTPYLSSINVSYYTSEPEVYYEINETRAVSAIENREFTINSSLLKTELDIIPSETFSNIIINITEPLENKPFALSRIKELEINAPELNDKISGALIRVYYTDEELGNINEDSLKIYYYNETSLSWQALISTVNKLENYVEADLEHFSTYGVFGEQNSGSSSSTGSGGKTAFIRGESPEPETSVETIQEPQLVSNEISEESLPAEVTAQTTLTGRAIQILTQGAQNIALLILLGVLIIAYIFFRMNEKPRKY